MKRYSWFRFSVALIFISNISYAAEGNSACDMSVCEKTNSDAKNIEKFCNTGYTQLGLANTNLQQGAAAKTAGYHQKLEGFITAGLGNNTAAGEGFKSCADLKTKCAPKEDSCSNTCKKVTAGCEQQLTGIPQVATKLNGLRGATNELLHGGSSSDGTSGGGPTASDDKKGMDPMMAGGLGALLGAGLGYMMGRSGNKPEESSSSDDTLEVIPPPASSSSSSVSSSSSSTPIIDAPEILTNPTITQVPGGDEGGAGSDGVLVSEITPSEWDESSGSSSSDASGGSTEPVTPVSGGATTGDLSAGGEPVEVVNGLARGATTGTGLVGNAARPAGTGSDDSAVSGGSTELPGQMVNGVPARRRNSAQSSSQSSSSSSRRSSNQSSSSSSRGATANNIITVVPTPAAQAQLRNSMRPYINTPPSR